MPTEERAHSFLPDEASLVGEIGACGGSRTRDLSVGNAALYY
jgi:hypothetical protein